MITEEEKNQLLREVHDAELTIANILKELQDRADVEVTGMQLERITTTRGKEVVASVQIECERRLEKGMTLKIHKRRDY